MYGFVFFKQKTEYEMRISDWSSDVCSSDLGEGQPPTALYGPPRRPIFRREILAPFKRPHADPALRSWPCYQAECRRISICRRPPPFGSHPMIQNGLSAPPPKRRAFNRASPRSSRSITSARRPFPPPPPTPSLNCKHT